MSDPLDPPEQEEPHSQGPHEDRPASYPWDDPLDPPRNGEGNHAEHGGGGPDAPRQRHDAFTEAKKCEFLKALVKTGGILDACRLAGVGARTVYRHQESDPRFFDHCAAALRMSATPVELTAWQRAVEGVEQEFACGGQVHVRRRYDGSLLRLLLQGSDPKKYGPRPGFKRKRLLKHERKQMEREIRAEIAAETPVWTFDEAIVALDHRLKALGLRSSAGQPDAEDQKLANGWTRSPEGDWVPPGYARIPGWSPPAIGQEPPRDSM